MNRKVVGAILLGSAGIMAAITAASIKIADAVHYAVVLDKLGGPVTTGYTPHWAIVCFVIALAVSGLFLFFKADKP